MPLYDRGRTILHALSLGSNSTIIRGIVSGTTIVDPPNAATGAETVSATTTIAGVAVGDLVLMWPPAALEDDLIPRMALVTGADQVTVYLYAAAAVDGADLTWKYLWFDLT